MDNQLKGYIFTILSSLLMSASIIISYIALQTINIATLTFYFFGFGVLGSVVLLLITGKLVTTKELFRKYWKPLVVIGLIGGVSSIIWFFALKLVGSSTLGFLTRFSAISTVVFALIFLKERLNRGEFVGGLIMIVGALIMMFKGGEGIVSGVILMAILSVIVALEAIFMKNYVKYIEPLVFNALRLLFTFLVVAIYAIARLNLMLPPPDVIFLIFLGAILSSVIGFVFYFKALEITDLSKVTIIRSIDPFVIFTYSLIFLGSIPTGLQLVGGVVIGIGAFFIVLARHKPEIIERILPNF